MNKNPLVSILTITYNRANLIHRCIESIQKQSYTNYEHIIVDGNSSDNTEVVVKSYCDPHIKYIKLNINGPQVQMKAGANEATGKYISFLDDDDEYLPEKLEKQVKLFETLSKDYGIVYCWMSYYNNDNPDKEISIHKTELRGFVGDIAPSRPLVSGTPTMMIRRTVFEEFGGTYDDSIGFIGSDWELMTRICQKYKVDYVPESLVKVYVNHGVPRLSTDFYSDKARKGILFHNHFLKTFKDCFDRHPRYAQYHFQALCRFYFTLGNRRESARYFKRYLSTYPPLVGVLSLLKFFIIGHRL